MNPNTIEFNTPFNSVPFSKITPTIVKESITSAIELAKARVQSIMDSEATPDYENTIRALEKAPKELSKVSHILFNLNSAETNTEIQQIAEELSPLLSDFHNFVQLNTILFEKIEYVHKNQDRKALTEEQVYYLDERYKSALRSGVNLPDAEKEKLKTIDQKLSTLSLQFGKNVLDATNDFTLVIEDESRLAGLPQSAKEMAKMEAKKRNLSAWVFTLQYPSLLPVMKFAQDRELRKELSLANGVKNNQENDFNNEALLKEIVALRQEKAVMLGYKTYSDFVLEDRMAKTQSRVDSFLNDLLEKAKPHAEKEVEELKQLALKEGIYDFQSYDHSFYAEKLKEQKFDYTEEETKPFFELNKVRDASFLLAQKLFGYEFQKRNDIEVYHPEVQVYEVIEKGQHKALLYLDFHPREGKRPGAWMTSYQDQCIVNNENIRPHVSVVCNFSRPTDSTPALLTFNEVTTLFHEMGHALHGISANTEFQALSGTSVLWDFVELPSQFLENYCYESEFLDEFARHYQTDEKLSKALIEKIKSSSNFMEGYQTVRQLSFGMLDMAYHGSDKKMESSVEDFEKEVMKPTQLYPNIDGSCMSTSFSHIFAGGYASGYYSYKWAEVLDADAFAYFKAHGIFNPEIARKLKHLLAMGGTVPPNELYEEFRGQPATNEALLERAGLG